MTEAKTTLNPRDAYAGLRAASPLSDEEKAFLAEVLPPERNSRGRFVLGKIRGPGWLDQKKGHGVYNFRRLVNEYLARAGNNAEDIVAALFEDLMWASYTGDTKATIFLVERLCGKDAELLDVNVTTAKLTDVERLARMQAILASATKQQKLQITVDK